MEDDPNAAASTVADGPSSLATSAGESAGSGYLREGGQLDRYVVLERVGEGGMGVVYRAYDPKLHREVAVKVIRRGRPRADDDEQHSARARLMREAQSMAQLSHPNVLPVYDVVTTDDDELLLTMEYVDGPNLRDWLRAEQRSVDAIIKVFTAVAEGLAAAHGAGLIHRDLKPSNVLLSKESPVPTRVQVMDFGLARAEHGGDTAEPTPTRTPSDAATEALSSPLTEHGAIVGTPPYMPPEQHMGKAIDPRADQYALCVALYEALHGERPFGGSRDELLRAKLALDLPDPSSRSVPGWLDRAVRTGLAPLPVNRFPSMRALVSALRNDKARRRRRWLAGTLAIGLTATAAWGLGFAVASSGDPCAGLQAELVETWSPARRATIAEGFKRAGPNYAQATWAALADDIDAYTKTWSSARTESCEATHVLHRQSVALYERQLACLETRRAALDALLVVFEQPDAAVVRNATRAVSDLPSISECTQLQASVPTLAPPPQQAQEAVNQIRLELAAAKATERTTTVEDALQRSEELLERARALDYEPLIAEATVWHGRRLVRVGDLEAGVDELSAGYFLAGAHKHHAAAAEAARYLIPVEVRRARGDAALLWGRHARMQLARLPPDRIALARLLDAEGMAHNEAGNPARAYESHREANAILVAELGPQHFDVAASLNRMSIAAGDLDRPKEAKELARQALALYRQELGTEHPDVAMLTLAYAQALTSADEYEAAGHRAREALATLRKSLPSPHPDIATALQNLGVTEAMLGNPDRAIELQREAIDVLSELFGPDHPNLAGAYINLGAVALNAGKPSDARTYFERALPLYEKGMGPDHLEVANPVMRLGDVALATKDYEGARAQYERALKLRLAHLERGHLLVVESRLGLARALAGLERSDDARQVLEQAIAEASPNVHEEFAEALESELRALPPEDAP